MEFWYLWPFIFLFIVLFPVLWHEQSKKKWLQLRIKKKKSGGSKMAIPAFVKNLIGKQVLIRTIGAVEIGIISEVQENWIKLVDKKDLATFVNHEMIVSIEEMPARKK